MYGYILRKAFTVSCKTRAGPVSSSTGFPGGKKSIVSLCRTVPSLATQPGLSRIWRQTRRNRSQLGQLNEKRIRAALAWQHTRKLHGVGQVNEDKIREVLKRWKGPKMTSEDLVVLDHIVHYGLERVRTRKLWPLFS